MLTKGQRAHTSLSLKFVSCLDPSISSSDSSSGKCDRAVTSTDRVPHQTPLVAMALICFSTSSATMAKDAANEDDPLASPSIKSRTNATDVYRASNSTSTWEASPGEQSSTHSTAEDKVIRSTMCSPTTPTW
jgi:hypothetical protein